METEFFDIQNKKENTFFNLLHWLSFIILYSCSLGLLCFAGPMIVNACIPEHKKTSLFTHNYKNSMNYILTIDLISCILILLWLAFVIIFAMFLVAEDLFWLSVILFLLFSLVTIAITVYYIVIYVIAIIKTINDETYKIPLVINFIK